MCKYVFTHGSKKGMKNLVWRLHLNYKFCDFVVPTAGMVMIIRYSPVPVLMPLDLMLSMKRRSNSFTDFVLEQFQAVMQENHKATLSSEYSYIRSRYVLLVVLKFHTLVSMWAADGYYTAAAAVKHNIGISVSRRSNNKNNKNNNVNNINTVSTTSITSILSQLFGSNLSPSSSYSP